MKSSWTKGLTPEQATEVRKDFQASAILRRRLKEICTDKIETSYTVSASKDTYSNPNWAYLQADARGYERALKEVLSLISDEK